VHRCARCTGDCGCQAHRANDGLRLAYAYAHTNAAGLASRAGAGARMRAFTHSHTQVTWSPWPVCRVCMSGWHSATFPFAALRPCSYVAECTACWRAAHCHTGAWRRSIPTHCAAHVSGRPVAQNSGYPVKMLNTQYRMHPSISCFPSQQFYGGGLLDGKVREGMLGPAAWVACMLSQGAYCCTQAMQQGLCTWWGVVICS